MAPVAVTRGHFAKEAQMKHTLKLAVVVLATVLLLSVGIERSGNGVIAPQATSAQGPVRTTAPVATAPDASAPGNAITLESPYRTKARMFRGQLHAHTTNSDGTQSPAAVVAAYKKAGYDFVAITDHNYNTPNPAIPGILFIPGVENDHTCLHENRINATTVAPGARLSQDVIDQARAEGSFVQINHPDWPGSYPANPCWSDKALLDVRGYDAIEAWNSSNDPSNNNAERRIDMLLSNGRRTNLTAVDDCHDVRQAYCMTASVNVFAESLTVADVMANLKSGNFYASFGVVISSVTANAGTVAVTVPKKCDIEFVADGGKVTKTERDVLAASYAVRGDEKYVRIRVTRHGDFHRAWTNPIYVTIGPTGG